MQPPRERPCLETEHSNFAEAFQREAAAEYKQRNQDDAELLFEPHDGQVFRRGMLVPVGEHFAIQDFGHSHSEPNHALAGWLRGAPVT